MDPGVVAVFIPIVAVGGFFVWMVSLSPLGKALAERVRHGAVPSTKEAGEREELLGAVEELRREVAELAERVDFTERLLARGSTSQSSPERPPVSG
ncbi:MAG TPA: hypothetical protein VKO86_11960 [Gemmatimonadales bacterium]|nr:hypothetical protein [Gemmatimonadales bacterium]